MFKNISILIIIGVLFIMPAANAQDGESSSEPTPNQILIKNVNIFDGKTNKLAKGMNVLVVDNLIETISNGEMEIDGSATVIEGGGRTLMPGMIDGHVHYMINAHFNTVESDMDLTDLSYRATLVAERALMDGFTAARDMGGPAFGLQRNIDNGIIIGPRIYPSGTFISQTSGHGDFRDRSDGGFNTETAHDQSNFAKFGIGTVADGIPEVLKAARTNLRNGASQIKIMAGGGGSSRFDPIDTTQYSKEEVCAIVEATKDWGTYVSAHVFNDRAMNRLMECGVMSFDHMLFLCQKKR